MIATDKSAMPPPPAWTAREPENEYHARSKSGEVMSSGMLKKFRDCPCAYRQAVLGLTPEKDSAAYRFGRAVHKIVLEGIPAFNRAYAVGGPINEKTGKSFGVGTKAHDEWLAANGYARDRVIGDDEAGALIRMERSARRHAETSALLEFGWPELAARADLHGVSCQVRMDWLTHDADGNLMIVDLKTTEDMTWFLTDARRYQYAHQFAFYRDVAPEELDYYSAENRAALEEFKRCQVEDAWPTGYEEIRTFTMPRMGA